MYMYLGMENNNIIKALLVLVLAYLAIIIQYIQYNHFIVHRAVIIGY